MVLHYGFPYLLLTKFLCYCKLIIYNLIYLLHFKKELYLIYGKVHSLPIFFKAIFYPPLFLFYSNFLLEVGLFYKNLERFVVFIYQPLNVFCFIVYFIFYLSIWNNNFVTPVFSRTATYFH